MNNDVKFVHNLYSQAYEKPRKSIDFIFVSIIIFLITILIWSNFAKVDEITKGDGKVIPSSKIQSIQSLDGGLLEAIYVKTGDIVNIDQPLMQIDTTRFQATFEENKESYNQWIAMRQRLELESSFDITKKTPKLIYTNEIKKIAKDYIKTQTSLYENRIAQLMSSLKVFDSQINQKKQELKELEAKIKQSEDKLKLITLERESVKKMVQTGIKSRFDLITVQKEFQQIESDIKNFNLQIPRIKYTIIEAETKKSEKIREFRTDASSELERISVEIKKVEARLVADNDKLAKTVIKSNVQGIVKEIYLNTIGGVIKSGIPLMDVIPYNDNLLIEAKIDPKDIAFINPSQKAMVKLSAYDYTIYGSLTGKIIEISADSIIDKESPDGKAYYKVIVQTSKSYLEKNGKQLPIIPGMIASIDIVTGEKTIMDFILKPILKIKQNSLTER